MTGRVNMITALLALAAIVSMMPAQAEEGDDAALKRQLDEVQQQLKELQHKVLDIESRIGAAQAPSTAGVPASVPSSTPAPAVVDPATVSRPAPAPSRVETGTSPSQTEVPAAFQWREMLKDQWRSVMAGMSSEEIGKLLGTPSRKLTLDGKPVWYYSYPGIGNGSVMFSRDGHTVAGWQHPPFGFW